MQTQSVIGVDLGSNTLRVCEIRLEDGAKASVVREFERVVGSAKGMSQSGLSSEAKGRILRAFAEARAEFDFTKKYLAVATEAFRRAADGAEFLAQIKREVGVKVRLIDPQTEAKLSFLGASFGAGGGFCGGFGGSFGASLSNLQTLIDLGGASTEVCSLKREQNAVDLAALARQVEGLNAHSFGFGIIHSTQKICAEFGVKLDSFRPLLTELVASKKQFLSEFFNRTTCEAREFLAAQKAGQTLLNSGVPTSVANLKLGLFHNEYDAHKVSGTRLFASDFHKAFHTLVNSSESICDQLVGKARGGLVASGILLLAGVFGWDIQNFCAREAGEFGTDEFVVVDYGVREGAGLSVALQLGV